MHGCRTVALGLSIYLLRVVAVTDNLKCQFHYFWFDVLEIWFSSVLLVADLEYV